MIRRVVVASILAVGAVLIALYVGDAAWAHYRLARATASDPREQVTVYDATALKSGRVEVFYERPRVEVCLHSLFPHFGYAPCWYLVRHHVKLVGLLRRADGVSDGRYVREP